MATPNNLTPTNCSWWPISALESDAAKPAEAPDAPEAASPAHWPKESLVLYHWTQSFSSQKVQPEKAGEPDRLVARTLGEGISVGLRGLMSWRETAGWNLGFRGRRTGAAGLLSWGGGGMALPWAPRASSPVLGIPILFPSQKTRSVGGLRGDKERQGEGNGHRWEGGLLEGAAAAGREEGRFLGSSLQALPLRCCPRYYRPPQVTAPLRLRLVGGLPLTGAWRVCL